MKKKVNNLVAKHMNTFNRSTVEKAGKGKGSYKRKQKHTKATPDKGWSGTNIFFSTLYTLLDGRTI